MYITTNNGILNLDTVILVKMDHLTMAKDDRYTLEQSQPVYTKDTDKKSINVNTAYKNRRSFTLLCPNYSRDFERLPKPI